MNLMQLLIVKNEKAIHAIRIFAFDVKEDGITIYSLLNGLSFLKITENEGLISNLPSNKIRFNTTEWDYAKVLFYSGESTKWINKLSKK